MTSLLGTLRGYHAVQVANRFLDLADAADKPIISVIKLIKLVYIAHGYHLAIYDKPLISGKTEAWKYGPIVLDVYYAFENQIGLDMPLVKMKAKSPEMSEEAKGVIKKVWENYGKFSRQRLSDLTHEPRTPWHEAAAANGLYSKIDNSLIQNDARRKRQ